MKTGDLFAFDCTLKFENRFDVGMEKRRKRNAGETGEELFGFVYQRGEVIFRQGEVGDKLYIPAKVENWHFVPLRAIAPSIPYIGCFAKNHSITRYIRFFLQ